MILHPNTKRGHEVGAKAGRPPNPESLKSTPVDNTGHQLRDKSQDKFSQAPLTNSSPETAVLEMVR